MSTMPKLLEDHDAFIMTSAYEGMPNALLEAMGRGCIPVVTDIDSGIPEVVKDGESGFLISVGDIEQFSDRIAQLQRDPQLRRTLSLNAYKAVDQGSFRIRDMADRYLEVFEGVMRDVESGRFRRPLGKILPPPQMRPMWRHYLPLPIYQAARISKRTLKHFAATSRSS